MKAMRLNAFGEGAPFEPFDKPDADPAPGEVAVRVHATSVNPVDTKVRADGGGDIAPDDPIVLGCDVSGVVMAVGPGASEFSEGDEVYGCAGGVKGRDGAYSQHMLVDERLLAKKPTRLSFREAAARELCARYLEEVQHNPAILDEATSVCKYDVSRQLERQSSDDGPIDIHQVAGDDRLLDAA